VYLDVTLKIPVLRLGHYILDENVYRKKLFEFSERVLRVLAIGLYE
jgi:hypothetical protein